MNIINQPTWDRIKAALRDVTDTFFLLPITVHVATEPSLDRFNEDRTDITYTDYTLNAFVEYNGNQNMTTELGSLERDKVKIQFDMRYLIEEGCADATRSIFNHATDYVTINGLKYKITEQEYDGQIQQEYILCILYAVVVKNYGV
jgi:hypothetical protein